MPKPFIRQHWHELYIELLANPNDHRTDKEFCEEIVIATSTLQTWKKAHRLEIFEEVQKRRNHYFNELRSLAWKELTAKMKKDLNAVKLAFQLTGDLVERTESKVENMNYHDKIDRINALLREANERQKTWKKVEALESGTPADSGNPPVSDGKLGDASGENPPASGEVRTPVDPKP